MVWRGGLGGLAELGGRKGDAGMEREGGEKGGWWVCCEGEGEGTIRDWV